MVILSRQEAPLGQPGDRRSQLYGSLITFLVINNVVIVSRVYVHFRTHYKARRSVIIEDVFALLSAHVWITMVLQGPTFTFIKLSLLFLYRRLFLVHQKWLRIAWWANLIYILLWAFGATGFYLFQCWPVQWYWLRYYQKFQTDPPYHRTGQCNATTVQHVALPLVFGLISDVAMLCLPITAILKLQVSTKKKLGLAAIFGVGTLACLLELARIVELFVDTDDSTDPSYGVVIFLILSAAEEVCAILCGSLPVVLPILYQQYKSWRHSQPSNSSSSRRRYKLNSGGSGLTKLSTVVVPPSRILGRGFGKLDEESDSSVELKSHAGGGATTVSASRGAGGGGAGWPFDDPAAPTYTVAAAQAAPVRAEDVVDDERDIVVRKEVHVTAVGGEDGPGGRF
ncbi:MAG: hypothetical protein Q9191_007482 [Dirinaria sp. TL-2023a]